MIVSNTPSETKSAHMSCFTDLELSPIRRLMLGPVYRKARRFRLYRERISSLYTFGYGVFRPYFLALGEHFVRRGVLSCREDIFYLYFDEVRAIVDKNQTGNEHADKIALRKCEMEAFRDIVVPETIYGDQAPPVDMRKSDKLTGIPTSRGYHTGPAKVVKGIQGFDKVQEGDVLVIPYSDVGWTPLFTKAGGVIAESGGILSHSSIVAREYGIPAVVSVSGACQLEDHTRVTVDGYKGEVIIHERPSRCVSSDTAIGEAASLENRFER
jgi:pyruvate,water dikinase